MKNDNLNTARSLIQATNGNYQAEKKITEEEPSNCEIISGRCAKAVVTVHCRSESTAPISKCTVGIMKCTQCKCPYISARFQTQQCFLDLSLCLRLFYDVCVHGLRLLTLNNLSLSQG